MQPNPCNNGSVFRFQCRINVNSIKHPIPYHVLSSFPQEANMKDILFILCDSYYTTSCPNSESFPGKYIIVFSIINPYSHSSDSSSCSTECQSTSDHHYTDSPPQKKIKYNHHSSMEEQDASFIPDGDPSYDSDSYEFLNSSDSINESFSDFESDSETSATSQSIPNTQKTHTFMFKNTFKHMLLQSLCTCKSKFDVNSIQSVPLGCSLTFYWSCFNSTPCQHSWSLLGSAEDQRRFNVTCSAAILACGSSIQAFTTYFNLIHTTFVSPSFTMKLIPQVNDATETVLNHRRSMFYAECKSKTQNVVLDARHGHVVQADHNTTTLAFLDSRYIITKNVHRNETENKSAVQTDIIGLHKVMDELIQNDIFIGSISMSFHFTLIFLSNSNHQVLMIVDPSGRL